ncbi:survival motor neuron protein (SMN) domain-containing protein [Ditylenchus destructor]|uniref:Survival motor neuron protein (SMN) domain-containing protein n=1 Tax=Ditylenchus destructor TaxID=166010 RepID=A0AAD4N4D0_9BILA|nr:survival motor neuron protein (SMN) domain-containing protein [Ditylenchus destructor]
MDSSSKGIKSITFHNNQNGQGPTELSANDLDDSELINVYNRISSAVKRSLLKAEAIQKTWKVGDSCLAKYSEDGLYYPARILNIFEKNKSCEVLYTEYDTSEIIKLSDLAAELDAVKDAPSDAKKISIEPETILKNADMNRLNHINMDNVLSNNEKNQLSLIYPPPPPGLFQQATPIGNAKQALCLCLMSWYLSGYYTGYYIALQRKR